MIDVNYISCTLDVDAQFSMDTHRTGSLKNKVQVLFFGIKPLSMNSSGHNIVKEIGVRMAGFAFFG